MSTAGIVRFGGWFAHAEHMREMITTEVEVMLRHGRAFTVENYPQSRKFLLEVARVIAKADPKVSDDPVSVKLREIAPEQINPAWAHLALVEETCARVAWGLTAAEAFAIYIEIGMDEPSLDLDVARAWGWEMALPDAARLLCERFAVRVFMAVADDNLVTS